MSVISATPAPLQAREVEDISVRQVTLSKRDKKYDRQLRLWAASGQDALENAHILLLNSGPGIVGIEALKNLILPGIGKFTIVDEAEVREEDLGANFFLSETSLGNSRAQATASYLQELNPEVTGLGVTENVETFVNKPNSLALYSLIMLMGPASSVILDKLSLHASHHSIPFFYMHSIGFYSHFSVQLPPHYPCVDTHPEPEETEDLRLLKPWPELTTFMRVKTRDMDTISDHEHGHIPYVLLLLYYLEVWKESHDGRPPSGYQEKKSFKTLVEQGARKSSAEGAGENFEEGIKAVNKSLNLPEISNGLRAIFEAEECNSPTAETPNFWIIANGIRDFHSRHGELPLPGALPDMKAQSADYIQLQNIYKAKARKDLAEVTDKVRATEAELMRDKSIDEREIEAFCKGAAAVKLIQGRPIKVAQAPTKLDWADTAKALCRELNDEASPFFLYIGFLAYDYTRSERRDAKGEHCSSSEPMVSYCNDTIQRLQSQAGLEVDFESAMSTVEKVVAELDRAGGGELHNISALTGGIIAQEVIKVITKQYIPFDNTCVFDGIASKAGVFRV